MSKDNAVDKFYTSEFLDRFTVSERKKISLAKDFDPDYKPDGISRDDASDILTAGIERLAEFQSKLYAQNTHGLLILLQAMDAAGKDSVIKHVMTGLNPQGCQVYNFKAPSPEERDHDYLWRCARVLPERGRIGIFNRSWYEEVLVVRVHPEILEGQPLPPELKDKSIWSRRFEEIRNFEQYLTQNAIHVVKIFLHVSKEEQRRRFLERIERPEKNWKFSSADVTERAFWNQYMDAYESMLEHTSTAIAPWYVVPADHKWVARLVVAAIAGSRLSDLRLSYPTISDEQKRELEKARLLLERE